MCWVRWPNANIVLWFNEFTVGMDPAAECTYICVVQSAGELNYFVWQIVGNRIIQMPYADW